MFVGICAPRRLANVTLIVPPGLTWIVGPLSDVGPGTSVSNGRAPSRAPDTSIVCGPAVSLTRTVPDASGWTCAGLLSGSPAAGFQSGGVCATLSRPFATHSMSTATAVATTVSPRITVLPLQPVAVFVLLRFTRALVTSDSAGLPNLIIEASLERSGSAAQTYLGGLRQRKGREPRTSGCSSGPRRGSCSADVATRASSPESRTSILASSTIPGRRH